MGRDVYRPSSVSHGYVLPIIHGGTSADNPNQAAINLGLVTNDMKEQPNGIFSLDVHSQMSPSVFPDSIKITGLNIDGPLNVHPSAQASFTITDYDSRITYTIVADNGATISRVNDVISFTAPGVTGASGFTINGKHVVINIANYIVLAPTITAPGGLTNVGPAIVLDGSAFTMEAGGSDTHVSSDWEISTSLTEDQNGNWVDTVFSTYNNSTYKTSWWEYNLLPNTTYYAWVRYHSAQSGTSDWSTPISFTTRVSFTVGTPTISAPFSVETDIGTSTTAQASGFNDFGTGDTFTEADWMLATDSGFTTGVVSATLTSGNMTQWFIDSLVPNTTYYLKVRYKGTVLDYSDWSTTVQFITVDTGIVNKPSITGVESGTNSRFVTTLNGSALSTSVGNHVISSSEWQISGNNDFSHYSSLIPQSGIPDNAGIVMSAVQTGASNDISFPLRGNVAYIFYATVSGNITCQGTANSNSAIYFDTNTTYYARVRYTVDGVGTSAWSDSVAIQTDGVVTPTLTYPADGAQNIPLSVTIQASTPVTFGGSNAGFDVFAGYWQLATSPHTDAGGYLDTGVTTNTPGQTNSHATFLNLQPNTDYYVKMYQEQGYFGSSALSTVLHFVTGAAAAVTDPVVTVSPDHSGYVDLATSANNDASVEAFSSTLGGDTLVSTEWEVSTDINFSNIISSHVAIGSVTWNQWTTDLHTAGVWNNIQLYLRARYNGSASLASRWSAPYSFISYGINAPTIASPTASQQGVSLIPVIQLGQSTYNPAAGINDQVIATDWEIYDQNSLVVSTYNNALYTQSLQTVDFTQSLPNQELAPSQQYQVRARYRTLSHGISAWSQYRTFSTMAAQVDTPSISSPVNASQHIKTNASFTANAFATTGGADTHVSTDWQFSTDVNFVTGVISSMNDTVHKTYLPSIAGLVYGSTYHARVRYHGAVLGASQWSNAAYNFLVNGAVYPNAEEAILTATGGQANDEFGYSVAMSADGQTVIVGTLLKNTQRGGAWIFVKNNGTWSQQTYIDDPATQADVDRFGSSVAISSDGNTAIIGASHHNYNAVTGKGVAYIYVRSGSTWTQQAVLTATDINSLSGSVGFGWNVTISADGNLAIAGAPQISTGGSAYVFSRSGTSWTQQAKITAGDTAVGDLFGINVNISSDGTTAIIGAQGATINANAYAGAAYVFTRVGSTWTQQTKLIASNGAANDQFGTSLAISFNGNTAIVGALSNTLNKGTAYAFLRTGNTWAQQAILNASAETATDYFAGGILYTGAISLSNDGNTAIIGAPGTTVSGHTTAGCAYVFTRSGATWTNAHTLNASDASQAAGYGTSVSISDDGLMAAVSAPVRNSVTGAVYIEN